jgi:hydrogenase maturation protease
MGSTETETHRQADKEMVYSPASESAGLLVSQSVVVIGYGNELRGDDAAGPLVARAVAEWDAPEVWALAVHQLTPELAEAIAAADLAVFVDACTDLEQEQVTAHPIELANTHPAIGHTGDPSALLALAESLYGHCPQAWSIAVPATSFDFSTCLSPVAERGVAAALQQIRDLIQPRIHEGMHEGAKV